MHLYSVIQYANIRFSIYKNKTCIDFGSFLYIIILKTISETQNTTRCYSFRAVLVYVVIEILDFSLLN